MFTYGNILLEAVLFIPNLLVFTQVKSPIVILLCDNWYPAINGSKAVLVVSTERVKCLHILVLWWTSCYTVYNMYSPSFK